MHGASLILGPFVITHLRQNSVENAINSLVQKIDPATFQEKFGASPRHLHELIQIKTISISQLMEMAPTGTIDPTSTLYVCNGYFIIDCIYCKSHDQQSR